VHKPESRATVVVMTAISPTPVAERPAALQLTLSGIAELARVQRPVASMWRTRFATGDDAFPAPIGRRGGKPVFDAGAVADWLVRTGHGNNPTVIADAAASAAPADFDWTDPHHIAELDALVVMSTHLGGLAGVTRDELREAASDTDPADGFLLREITRYIDRGARWTDFVDALIDAAYSPAGALQVTHARHAATKAADGSAGPLTSDAWELTVEIVAALARTDRIERVVIDRGIDEEAAVTIARQLDEEIALATASTPLERALRRRFQVEDLWADDDSGTTTAVRVARVPVVTGDNVDRMVADAEDVALALGHADAAVVLGPARALIDVLPTAARRIRDDVLRSGRLRAAIRLPRGLITAAIREPLALWVLGPPAGQVPLDERVTAIADLIDSALTPAVRGDLVSDVLAGMGTAADVRARTFRFARLTRTASLLARSGALLPARTPRKTTPSTAAALATRLDAAAQTAAIDLPHSIEVRSEPGPTVELATLRELIDAGHARLIPGTRLSESILGDTGFTVVTARDFEHLPDIGTRRVDPLTFAQQHPTAQLTRPGDVIFRTGPSPAAWVDPDGSKAVAFPARVLRITAADPGGLMPEVVAADIASQPGGPGAWRRWMLRRIAPAAIAPLHHALAELDAARTELERRIAALDQYADTLTAAVAAGAVTLTDPNDAATAAPAPQ